MSNQSDSKKHGPSTGEKTSGSDDVNREYRGRANRDGMMKLRNRQSKLSGADKKPTPRDNDVKTAADSSISRVEDDGSTKKQKPDQNRVSTKSREKKQNTEKFNNNVKSLATKFGALPGHGTAVPSFSDICAVTYAFDYSLESENDGDVTYTYSAYDEEDSTFLEYVGSVLQTGDIVVKSLNEKGEVNEVKLVFVEVTPGSPNDECETCSYTDTTCYDRAYDSNSNQSVFVAGEILTFKCKKTSDLFNIAIYITEVATGDENSLDVTSRIETGVLNKPEETVISTFDETSFLASSCDTNGNTYVIKEGKTVEDILPYLKVDESGIPVVIMPSNVSAYTGVSPNENYECGFDGIFQKSFVDYVDDMRNPRTEPRSESSTVILPSALPSPSATETIKAVDCFIKGIVMFYRNATESGSGKKFRHVLIFDMCRYNRIRCYNDTSSSHVVLEMPWLSGYLDSGENLTINSDSTNVSPFATCATSFYNNNIHETGDDKTYNFEYAVHTPNFFADSRGDCLDDELALMQTQLMTQSSIAKSMHAAGVSDDSDRRCVIV